MAKPTKNQREDIDFLLALGELFTLVVYGQLILENARICGIDDDVVDQIFDFMVRDFSEFALQLFAKPSSNRKQMSLCAMMVKKPAVRPERAERIWEKHVFALRDVYVMNE